MAATDFARVGACCDRSEEGEHVFKHPVNKTIMDDRTFGQKAADTFTAGFGTWTYILIQTGAIVVWMIAFGAFALGDIDPYPFILLNLAFSAQAAFAAPLILMASNRSAQRDRLVLEHEATETETILQIQDTQVELLKAIKTETALLHEVLAALGREPAPQPGG
jgi:uncharacterized membrane protein